MKKALVLILVIAIAAAAGVVYGYQRWFKPPVTDPNPVAQFNGLLLAWDLRLLPRPSASVQPGSILSSRYTSLVDRAAAWSKPDELRDVHNPLIESATYRDTRTGSGDWKTVLPALGPLSRAQATLGLSAATIVETKIENVEIVEVPESALAPEQLTEQARKFLDRGVVVVREVCRIKRLTYRFLDKDGKTIGANAEAAKATVEAGLSSVATDEGALVLKDVCVAIGPCVVFYAIPAALDATGTKTLVASLSSKGVKPMTSGSLVRFAIDGMAASEAADFAFAEGEKIALTKQLSKPQFDPTEWRAAVERMDHRSRDVHFAPVRDSR